MVARLMLRLSLETLVLHLERKGQVVSVGYRCIESISLDAPELRNILSSPMSLEPVSIDALSEEQRSKLLWVSGNIVGRACLTA